MLDDALARIASMDGEFSSFIAIDADRARRTAEAAEEELRNGRAAIVRTCIPGDQPKRVTVGA